MVAEPAAPAFGSVAEAAQTRLSEVVMDMVRAGYDVNAQDLDSFTALHWAANFGLEGLASQLLEAGARADIPNSRGELPVHLAARATCLPLLRVLVAAGRETIAVRDSDGFTPFMTCAQEDGGPVLEWLFLQGSNVQETDDRGQTPLMWACYNGYRRTVQWLLSRNACVAARDNDGLTALHWATVRNQDTIAKSLLEVGAAPCLLAADRGGDTPLRLAWNKSQWSLLAFFLKTIVCQIVFGRPYLMKNARALLFLALAIHNILVVLLLAAPRAWDSSPWLAVASAGLMSVALFLWFLALRSDPGCAHSRTLVSQDALSQRLAREGVSDMWRRSTEEQLAAAVRADAQLRSLFDDERSPEDCEDVEALAAVRAGAGDSWLQHLELQQLQLAQQQQLLDVVQRTLKAEERKSGRHQRQSDEKRETASRPSSSLRRLEFEPLIASVEELSRMAALLPGLARRVAVELGRERPEHLARLGREDYLRCVGSGKFRQVCAICHSRQSMRAYHCKECGRCIQRLDHHCPWIDNCVGLGNQRLFFVFIVVIFTALVLVMVLLAHGIRKDLDHVFHKEKGWAAIPGALSSSQLSASIVMIVSFLLDLVWLSFVGMLLVRQTAYISVNLTTYEVLITPSHVLRRFPERSRRLWYMSGFSLCRALRSCTSYWTRDSSWDASDFGIAADEDIIVTPPARDASQPEEGCCVEEDCCVMNTARNLCSCGSWGLSPVDGRGKYEPCRAKFFEVGTFTALGPCCPTGVDAQEQQYDSTNASMRQISVPVGGYFAGHVCKESIEEVEHASYPSVFPPIGWRGAAPASREAGTLGDDANEGI